MCNFFAIEGHYCLLNFHKCKTSVDIVIKGIPYRKLPLKTVQKLQMGFDILP